MRPNRVDPDGPKGNEKSPLSWSAGHSLTGRVPGGVGVSAPGLGESRGAEYQLDVQA